MSASPPSHSSNGELEIALPEPGEFMEQDAEWCVVRHGKDWERIRFHDYERIFSIPGLYEKVICEILECRSPDVITDLLLSEIESDGQDLRALRVIDLGAGNGMVGELLHDRGVGTIVGVDIIREAAEATQRDRPGIYRAYHVVNMATLPEESAKQLREYGFNAMVCVAALGFGDIPVEAFVNTYNLVATDGWIAFNIKEEFLDSEDSSGFSELVKRLTTDGSLEVRARRRYQHRLGVDREPIHYMGFVGRKKRDIA